MPAGKLCFNEDAEIVKQSLKNTHYQVELGNELTKFEEN